MMNPNAGVLNAYYLKPIYNHQKSFYNKAYVKKWGSYKELYSYNTRVAIIKLDANGMNEKLILGRMATCSATTLKHVKEWLYQEGFEVYSKSELSKHYEVGKF